MFTKNDDNDSSFYRVTRKNCYFYMQLKKHEQIEKYAAKQEAKKLEEYMTSVLKCIGILYQEM